MADHMDAIAAELVKDMGSRLWRNREASCHALAALLQVPSHFTAQELSRASLGCAAYSALAPDYVDV